MGHVLSKEASDEVKDGLPKHSRRNGRGKGFKNPDDEDKMSAQSLVGASDYKTMKCGFCAKSHEASRCPTALFKTPDERWDMLMKRKGAPTCFNCLQPGSISTNSRSKSATMFRWWMWKKTSSVTTRPWEVKTKWRGHSVPLWACVYNQAKSDANCKCKTDIWR